ncbi:MAG: threonine synthase [Ignavibacteriaceae bacterium]
MNYYSTNKKSKRVSFKEAVIKGIADDGGLFMPDFIPVFPGKFISEIKELSFHEISYKIASFFIEDEIPSSILNKIIERAINFDAPLFGLNENTNILELFHGPTLAFKDFGARFMAEILSYFSKESRQDINILVATSGDTGSAVSNGFFNMEGIKVYLLYPSKKVSHIQEMQLTTLDGNITALEVEGTFDDCQTLVKQAFLDSELTRNIFLSSANSINVARLLPQSFYYFNAYKQLKDKNKPLIFSVPSGNFGNLTGGLISKKMGLPVDKFISAVNANDVFPIYLNSGKFIPKPSVKTISNAMDVGNPSNFYRILDLYENNWNKINNEISSYSISDPLTKDAIKKIYNEYKYLIDPHGAVGFQALNKYVNENHIESFNGIILETAHPSKFIDIMEEIVKENIKIPDRLEKCLHKEKKSLNISNEYDDFKNYLLNQQ